VVVAVVVVVGGGGSVGGDDGGVVWWWWCVWCVCVCVGGGGGQWVSAEAQRVGAFVSPLFTQSHLHHCAYITARVSATSTRGVRA
jgi:hypothetical protein